MPNSCCPRCHGFLGDDPEGLSCFNCGYVQYQGPGLGVTAATMSQPPGLTAEIPMERYEDGQAEGRPDRRGSRSPAYWQRRKERERIEDEALGQAVARRLGVTLEDLRSNAQHRFSGEQREAVVELRSLGLSFFRIGNLLARNENVIRAVLAREKRAGG